MTNTNDPLLSRDQIVELLNELGADLAARGVKAHLFVVGGAAMTLAFNTRRLTRDVDGVYEPKTVVYEAASRLAAKHDALPENWLNDAVKELLPGRDPGAIVVLDLPGIAVSVPSARYLLALKVQAARIDRDADDIQFLARQCGVSTADEVLTIAEEVLGRRRLLPKSQFLVQEMFTSPAPASTFRRIAHRLLGRELLPTANADPDSSRDGKPTGNPGPDTPPPARPTPKPARCPGHTRAGRRCVLRAGHGGHHRGR